MAQSILDIIFRTKKEGTGDKETATGLKGIADGFKSVTGISLSAAGAIGAVTGAIKFSIQAAMESEKVQAQTEATIRATGGAAGYTADEIGRLALAESRLTSIDDEVVQGGMNMLLTFKNIGKETFPVATRALEDMAVAMNGGSTEGVNLKDTAIQLGKALNDPLTGMSALQRVGVTFSETQKQQIKDFMAVNDVAGAQKVILDELQTEFGGVAQAAGETTAGAVLKLKNEIGNLGEAAGSVAIGPLTKFFNTLTNGLIVVEKLANWQKDLQLVYDAEYDNVTRNAKTYEEYEQRLRYLAEVQERYINSTGDLVNAKGKLIEANYLASESEWELYNTSQMYDEHLRAILPNQTALNEAVLEGAGAAEEAYSAVNLLRGEYDNLGKLDVNFGSKIVAELDKIKFYLAGGQPLQEITEAVSQALQDAEITPQQAQAMFEELYVGSQVLQVKMDDITAEEAAQNVSETLNVSLEAAKKLVDDTIANWSNFPRDIYSTLHITVQTNQQFGGTGGSVFPGDYNPDTGEYENRDAGGPVMANRGYMVGERGIEWFRPVTTGTIIPNNLLGAGGVNITISGPITINDQRDIVELANELATEIQRSMR